MVHRFMVLLLLVTLLPATAIAHGVAYAVRHADAVEITVTHEDGSPVAGASFTVTAPDAARPSMTGITDAAGRLVFVPDHDGDWTVEVRSADGHGLTTAVPWTAADGTADKSVAPSGGLRMLMGVLIAGATGYLGARYRHRT